MPEGTSWVTLCLLQLPYLAFLSRQPKQQQFPSRTTASDCKEYCPTKRHHWDTSGASAFALGGGRVRCSRTCSRSFISWPLLLASWAFWWIQTVFLTSGRSRRLIERKTFVSEIPRNGYGFQDVRWAAPLVSTCSPWRIYICLLEGQYPSLPAASSFIPYWAKQEIVTSSSTLTGWHKRNLG